MKLSIQEQRDAIGQRCSLYTEAQQCPCWYSNAHKNVIASA